MEDKIASFSIQTYMARQVMKITELIEEKCIKFLLCRYSVGERYVTTDSDLN